VTALRASASWLGRQAALISAGLALATIAVAQIPGWHVGELARAWSGHAALLLLPGWITYRHDPRWGRLFLLAVVVALLPWLRAAYQERAYQVPAASERLMSVSYAHLRPRTPGDPALRLALAGGSSDLIGLTGATASERALWAGDARHPHQIWLCDRDHPDGPALLSSARIVTAHVLALGDSRAIDALIDLGDGPLRVLLVHLSAPTSAEGWAAHRRELVALASSAASVAEPLLVMGDLNTTPGDPLWPVLLKAGRLLPPPGHAPATWPTWLGPCGISLDHLLVRGAGVDAVQAVRLPDADHRGLRAVLTVPFSP
jgi:endonuclease/exonuclease/phosphatase family metal-dependent hydrolase